MADTWDAAQAVEPFDDRLVDSSGVFAPVLAFQGYRRIAVEGRISAAVPYLLLAYACAWIAVPLLTAPGLRTDTYEMLAMGHEWQLSYWKHPALPPWVAEAVFDLSGHSVIALQILPIFCVVAALWIVWKLCQPILGTNGAAIATVLSMCSWYVMTPVTQFNHNVAQLPFWALCVFCYRRAMQVPTYLNWTLFGLVAALLMQTKLTGALLLLTLAVHSLWFAEGRKVLARPAAWVGIALGAALVTAQFLQLYLFQQSALTYAASRPAFHRQFDDVLSLISLIGAQAFFHLAIALILLAACPFGKRARERALIVALPERARFDTSLLVACTAAPVAMGVLFYEVGGYWGRSEAFGSMFILAGPSVVALLPRILRIARPKFAAAIAALAIVLPPIASIGDVHRQRMSHRLRSEDAPYATAAGALQQDWLRRTGRPLHIIAGDATSAGGLAAFMQPRPSVLIDGSLERSPWITPKMIETQGTMIVWRIDAHQPAPPAALMAGLTPYPVHVLEPLQFATARNGSTAAVQFGVAIIMPCGQPGFICGTPTASRTSAAGAGAAKP